MNSEFEWQYAFDLFYYLLAPRLYNWLDTGILVPKYLILNN